jgi:putative DNA primase/helicase
MFDVFQQFRAALIARGIVPPTTIVADGQFHRCDVEGPGGKGDATYLLHNDGVPAGGFQNWRDGQDWQPWRAEIGRELSKSEGATYKRLIAAAKRKNEIENAARTQQARANAARQLKCAYPAIDHPYLAAKGIEGVGVYRDAENLLIPVRDTEGELHSVQFIGPSGRKRFLSGGRVTGCFFLIGEPSDVLCIAEGFATGASVHKATGYAVAVAFHAGNLMPVAKALREKYRDIQLILSADDDYVTEGNPGLTKATEAAKAVGGLLAVPDFGPSCSGRATDFNDLYLAKGQDAVRLSIDNALLSGDSCEFVGDAEAIEWPKPLDLSMKLDSLPYPLAYLPPTVCAAVEEVQGFTKAPVALVALSAIAALSLAIQPYYDVKRADKLEGPVSLYLLTIADSGERKSTCDGYFTKAIREHEAAQAELAKPKCKEHKSAMDIWEAKHGGIKEKIRKSAKENKPLPSLESALCDLEFEKPEPPRVPRMLYADATPEALAYGLAKTWPSGGVVSAEAGVVFGSHGMGKDSVMRNLAQLNVLWDGGSVAIDRKTGESFATRGARLTVALQVQEVTLRDFLNRSGGLARGTGFLPRFLVAWPESTQGFRPFTEAPPKWPALDAFNKRIARILEETVPIDERGVLTPILLVLGPEAKSEWVEFHDRIEKELSVGGALHDVRDVASKIADNAARLAALFHIFEGASGAISLQAFTSARQIAEWHLYEARRFFGEIALPTELADAVRLDRWLLDHCRRQRSNIVARRDVQRTVTPAHLRQKMSLDQALRELVEAGRVVIIQKGRQKEIHVNPALFGDNELTL